MPISDFKVREAKESTPVESPPYKRRQTPNSRPVELIPQNLTVRELRKILAGLPQSARILVSPEGWGWWNISHIVTDTVEESLVWFEATEIFGIAEEVMQMRKEEKK